MRYGARIVGRRPIGMIEEERSRRYEAKNAVKAMLQERMIWRNLLHKYGTLQGGRKNHPIPLECCVRNTHAWFLCYTKNILRYIIECKFFTLFDVRIHKTHPMKMNKVFRKDLPYIHGSGGHVSGSSLKASRSSQASCKVCN